jgi:hypothetical protein
MGKKHRVTLNHDPQSQPKVTASGHNSTPVACGHQAAGRRRGGVVYGGICRSDLGRGHNFGHNLVTPKFLQLLVFHKLLNFIRKMVGDTGIEPVTPAV